MTGDDIYDLAANVKSRSDFIKFVTHLNSNYEGHREEWENDNLESFLGGLSGFAQDMGGYYKKIMSRMVV